VRRQEGSAVTEGAAGAVHKKRSGRRAGPTSTQHEILETARSLFSAEGFEGTTMRAIAHASAVDAALIHHFFLSKEALFTVAVQDAFAVADLVPAVVDGTPERAGERLARAFITYWETPGIQPRLVSLLRSATAFEGASTTIKEFLGTQVLLPVTTALGYGKPELRASLVGSQLLGLAVMRHVIRSEAIVSLRPEQLVFCIADTCQHYLVERV
jgi:AcrR family transcriptional regulator